jgi:serine/threonine protein kinase
MWSIGIITYYLLTGKLPFDHDFSEKEIAKQIINEVPNLASDLGFVSKEALFFVTSKRCYKHLDLLSKKQEDRMTVKDALNHPWIKKYIKKSQTVDSKIILT